MEKFIEKFTFYDILGYGLPGLLCLYISYIILYPFLAGMIPRYSINNDITFVLIVLCASHVTGSILSEISYWAKKLLNKGIKHEQNEVIHAAEERSGLIDKVTPVAKDKETNYLKKNEIQIMYADLQTSQKYNRIHNYCSVEIMCKNVAAAFFLNSIISLLYGLYIGSYKRGILSLILFACGILLSIRSERFREKKEMYTIMWFVEKYNNAKTECNVQAEKKTSP